MGDIRIKCTHCGAERRYGGVSTKVSCTECGGYYEVNDGIIHFYSGNRIARQLAKGPTIGMSRSDLNNLRHVAEVLPAPSSRNRGKKDWPYLSETGSIKNIIYLPGDERQAVSIFIQEYPELVDMCIRHGTSNPIQYTWDEYFYEILKEQWFWLGYGDGHVEEVAKVDA